jgi:hypothetical protein
MRTEERQAGHGDEEEPRNGWKIKLVVQVRSSFCKSFQSFIWVAGVSFRGRLLHRVCPVYVMQTRRQNEMSGSTTSI